MKRMLIYLYVLTITILFIPISSISQSKFSIEAGAAYIFNLSYMGDPQELENARGFNIGFNYHLKQETILNIQFGYMSFPFEGSYYRIAPDMDRVYSIAKYENIIFYNLSFAFRAFFRNGGINPFFSIGAGLHFINTGTMFNDGKYDYRHFDNKSSTIKRKYSSIGLGLSIPVFNQFDILINSSLSISSQVKYILIPFNLAFNYNF